MKNNTQDHIIEYGSRHAPESGAGHHGRDGRADADSPEHAEGLLSSSQLRQLRSELQQRRLNNEGALRRKLARLFKWLG